MNKLSGFPKRKEMIFNTCLKKKHKKCPAAYRVKSMLNILDSIFNSRLTLKTDTNATLKKVLKNNSIEKKM